MAGDSGSACTLSSRAPEPSRPMACISLRAAATLPVRRITHSVTAAPAYIMRNIDIHGPADQMPAAPMLMCCTSRR